jgi:hypothetical protein
MATILANTLYSERDVKSSLLIGRLVGRLRFEGVHFGERVRVLQKSWFCVKGLL